MVINKWNIGDRVISKKTGLPVAGDIIGILDATLYLGITSHTSMKCYRWFDLYPDWQEGLVLAVKFDEPQKHLTKEEFVASSQANYGVDIMPNEVDVLYKFTVRSVNCAYYPEEDLELL